MKDSVDPLPKDRRVTCCDHFDVRPRRWFERLVLLMIVVSSITIAVDVPRLPHDSTAKVVLERMTHVFTVTFTFEMVVKMVAWSPAAYFADSWNVLDFNIVMVSLLSFLVFALPELESLMAIRVLRVLRPLRLLARNEGTRLVMTVLFTSFPIVSAILAVVIFVMTVFASSRREGPTFDFSSPLPSLCSQPFILTPLLLLNLYSHSRIESTTPSRQHHPSRAIPAATLS